MTRLRPLTSCISYVTYDKDLHFNADRGGDQTVGELIKDSDLAHTLASLWSGPLHYGSWKGLEK